MYTVSTSTMRDDVSCTCYTFLHVSYNGALEKKSNEKKIKITPPAPRSLYLYFLHGMFQLDELLRFRHRGVGSRDELVLQQLRRRGSIVGFVSEA